MNAAAPNAVTRRATGDPILDDLLAARDHYAALRDAVPDPNLEPVPARREALVAQQQRHHGEYMVLHRACGDLENLNRKSAPVLAVRSAILEAIATLTAPLAEKQSRLAEIDKADPSGRSSSPLRNEIAAIEGAVDAAKFGFDPDFGIPRALLLALPVRIDPAELRPLHALDRIADELDERRQKALDRARPLLDAYTKATSATGTGAGIGLSMSTAAA